MKKKILCNFWIPGEVLKHLGDDFDLVYPKEEIAGHFGLGDVIPYLNEVNAVLIDGLPFDKSTIDKAGPQFQVIGRHGVGCDAVDCEYAGKKGIAVVNTPQTVTQPTAELAITLLLDTARNVSRLDRAIRGSNKCVTPFSFSGGSVAVYGKTLGIIGFGRIGKAVGVKARGLGLKVIYFDPIRAAAAQEAEIGVKHVPLEELLKIADFVTLHCPYVPENHHLINEKTLSLMKPSAFLVNASRGKMVDETALAAALKNKTIAGAGLDVYEFEPEINQELIQLENVVLAPHIGTWSRDTRLAMAKEALDGICKVLRGEDPLNVFNREFLVKK
jgi:lactate dehydrogenase-like 2-hydroxyacid dehydrogenase